MDYQYEWLPPGVFVTQELIEECANLFSNHYGFWSAKSKINPGEKIQFAPQMIKKRLSSDEVRLATARYNNVLIGYAIAIQKKLKDVGTISWVTQFVVHKDHRENGVGKNLLFSIWSFSDHFAWGLVSANPYAVRALEKATRRRCVPVRIKKNKIKLINFGENHIDYINDSLEHKINNLESSINTQFYVDHTNLNNMIDNVTSSHKPWELGGLDEGWEWFAFTFNDQTQISLTPEEIEKMLQTTDQVTRQAYSRMRTDMGSHAWTKHTEQECRFIVEWCSLKEGDRIVDFGCGNGRHIKILTDMGMMTTGVDYNKLSDSVVNEISLRGSQFIIGDCRQIKLQEKYNAVICLYDVIGSYVDQKENISILENIYYHLKVKGRALISVMNYELTEYRARNKFSLELKPDAILTLPASQIMETTGDIFDPKYYLIDEKTHVIYRKEQFQKGHQLPVELIVRDRRYCKHEIKKMCESVGFKVLWAKFVRAGGWSESLSNIDERAKEILVLCEK